MVDLIIELFFKADGRFGGLAVIRYAVSSAFRRQTHARWRQQNGWQNAAEIVASLLILALGIALIVATAVVVGR